MKHCESVLVSRLPAKRALALTPNKSGRDMVKPLALRSGMVFAEVNRIKKRRV
jgi:hypothetical protein